jgi:hypothetical protein
MEELTRSIQDVLPWCMLLVNDILLMRLGESIPSLKFGGIV